MNLFRGKHKFSKLNREYKQNQINTLDFLENVIQEVKDNIDMNKDALEYSLHELVGIISNNDLTIADSTSEIFVTMNKIITASLQFKQPFTFPQHNPFHDEIENYRKYLYQLLFQFEENLDKMEDVNIQNAFSFFQFIEKSLQPNERISLICKVFTSGIEKIINMIQAYDISIDFFNIFREYYKDLDYKCSARIFETLHKFEKDCLIKTSNSPLKDFFKGVDSKYILKLMYHLEAEEEHFVILSIFTLRNSSESLQNGLETKAKALQKIRISNGEAFMTTCDQELILYFGSEYFSLEIIPTIVEAINLSNESAVTYICALGDLVSIFEDQLLSSEKYAITEMFSKCVAKGSQEVKDACYSKIIEFSSVIPIHILLPQFFNSPKSFNSKSFQLILDVSEKFLPLMEESWKVGEQILQYLLKIDSMSHTFFDNFVRNMDFKILRDLILMPLKNLNQEHNLEVPCAFLAVVVENHYSHVDNKNRVLMRDLFLAMSENASLENPIVLDSLIRFSKLIVVQDFEPSLLQVWLKIPVEKNQRKLLEFMATLYEKVSESYKGIFKVLFNRMIFEHFDETVNYTDLLIKLDPKDIENNILPKMLNTFSRNIRQMTSFFCHSFYLVFDKLSMESKHKVSQELVKLCLTSRMDVFQRMSIVENYDLKPKDVIVKELSKVLLSNDCIDRIKFKSWTGFDRKYEILRATVFDELENSDVDALRMKTIFLVLNYVFEFLNESEREMLKPIVKARISVGDVDLERAEEILFKIRNPENTSPGIAIIFNNDEWPDNPHWNRMGSRRDVENLKKTFEMFSIFTLVVQNPEIQDISDVISKVNDLNFSNTSCVIIVTLTHGHPPDKMLARNGFYNFHEDVIKPLIGNENHTLKNVPKLFFVQACKGEYVVKLDRSESSTTTADYDDYNYQRSVSVTSNKNFKIIPSDILRFDSTYEGFKSLRLRDSGTPFIIALCETILKHGEDKDMDEIVKITKVRIKEIAAEEGFEQYASRSDTLSKAFVFGNYRSTKELIIPSTEDIDWFFKAAKHLFHTYSKNSRTSVKRVPSIRKTI